MLRKQTCATDFSEYIHLSGLFLEGIVDKDRTKNNLGLVVRKIRRNKDSVLDMKMLYWVYKFVMTCGLIQFSLWKLPNTFPTSC